MTATSPATTARVFFALWPDAAVRQRLHEVGRCLLDELGGQLTHAPSIHMTLLFLGNVEALRLDALRAAAGSVTLAPFAMAMKTLDCWRHNRVAWIGPERAPVALSDGVEALRESMSAAGFAFDRKPFAAHVTLLRNARCAPVDVAFDAIPWQVRDFVLMRSAPTPGVSRYEVISRWPAGGAT
jgi:2'-5' RNA ligase